MPRAMLVTVGTSLLHSASWEPDEGLRIEIPPYAGWMAREFLASPDLRRSDVRSAFIRAKLEERLTATNAWTWTERLPRDLRDGAPAPGTFMRYSAELSTILKLGEASNAPDARHFLHSYGKIELAYDPVSYGPLGTNLPAAVAEHLAAYLDAIAGGRVASHRRVSGISSGDPQVLLAALHQLRGELAQEAMPTDLIISGGYKTYGIVLAPLAGPRIRIVFLHESARDLVVYDGRVLDLGGCSLPWISEPL